MVVMVIIMILMVTKMKLIMMFMVYDQESIKRALKGPPAHPHR
jgi:hypothetical protein